MTDVFALQDEITKKVVAAIEPKLLEAEGIRSQRRSPENLDAWEMVIHANSLFWRLTKSDGEAAIAILKKAINRYPEYAPAHSMLAFAMLVSRLLGWTLHLALGYAAYMMRHYEEAQNEYQRAIDLNPNFAAAYGCRGFALASEGQSEQAIPDLEQAIRMSPAAGPSH